MSQLPSETKYTDYPASKEQLDVIRGSVCKDLNNTEFYYFMNVCHSINLNPFLKQVWCFKDREGKVQIFTSRDGYYANAERHKGFRGLQSSEIRKNDSFSCDMVTGEVVHQIKSPLDRGDIIGAWAKVFRDGMPPRLVLCPMSEHIKPSSQAWRTNPAQMIVKCAEAIALKKQFPLPGIQHEEDWEIRDNVAYPSYKDAGFMNDEQRKELYELIQTSALHYDEQDEYKEYVRKAVTVGEYKELRATLVDFQPSPIDRIRNGDNVSMGEINRAVKERIS